MQSIVVAVDEPYRELIEEAAGEIKAVTGRKDLAAATRPHFTLHAAERYSDGVNDALAGLATVAQLRFETGAIGIFRGPNVVIALEVVRGAELLQLHERVVEAVMPLAEDAKPAYATATWAPHITIAAGRLDDEQVEGAMAVLARRDFAWRGPVTNLCLVPSPKAREWTRFDAPVTG